MYPIRISITEMLEESTIKDIGADHADLAVCVTRICGHVRRQEEEITALKRDVLMLRIDRTALAKLAAETPQFFNPLHVASAKQLRDQVLAGKL